MRPFEFFSTSAANRFQYSCWVSLMVAVLSFMTKVLSCASATGAQQRVSSRGHSAEATPIVVSADDFLTYAFSNLPCAT